ncbi:MAG: hypothetical protein ACI835_004332 [Planctomycetota bacterium]|jgi:hypothetical protein
MDTDGYEARPKTTTPIGESHSKNPRMVNLGRTPIPPDTVLHIRGRLFAR